MASGQKVTTFTAGNCYSYMVSDGGQAVIIDPHLTLVDKYDKALRRRGAGLTFADSTNASGVSPAVGSSTPPSPTNPQPAMTRR